MEMTPRVVIADHDSERVRTLQALIKQHCGVDSLICTDWFSLQATLDASTKCGEEWRLLGLARGLPGMHGMLGRAIDSLMCQEPMVHGGTILLAETEEYSIAHLTTHYRKRVHVVSTADGCLDVNKLKGILRNVMPLESKLIAPHIYLSYARKDATHADIEHTVNVIDTSLSRTPGWRVVRDSRDLHYRDSIRDFMKRIGTGWCVVAVFSDKYFRSQYCMYELCEIARQEDFMQRLFPLCLENTLLYELAHRKDIHRFWQDKLKATETAVKRAGGITKMSPHDKQSFDDLQNIAESCSDVLAELANAFSDVRQMVEDDCARLRAEIERRLRNAT